MKGIIYKWTCSKTGKSYIGQTINESRREADFFSYSKPYTCEGSKIDNARKKYGLSKDIWKKEILKKLWCKNGKEKELFKRLNHWECYYIEKYNTFSNGYNSTIGGSSSFLMPEEEKEERRIKTLTFWKNASESKKNSLKYWKGKNRDSKTNEINREKHIGKLKSEEEKEKIKKSILLSDGYKKSCKQICQYDLDGNLLKIHESINDAAKSIKCKKTHNIVNCANGKQEKSHGYIWKFLNNENAAKERKGYYFHKRLQKYKSRIRKNGKDYVLGFFWNEKSASEMYKYAYENLENLESWFKNIEKHKKEIIEKYGA